MHGADMIRRSIGRDNQHAFSGGDARILTGRVKNQIDQPIWHLEVLGKRQSPRYR
jgi:hypothetical protein